MTEWSKDVQADGASVTYEHNQRMYLSTVNKVDTAAYFKPDLLGGSMEFDLDLSQVGCNCVVGLYGVRMPAVDNTDDKFGYCGANQDKVGGSLCPEFDMLEGNSFGIHTTAHSCEAPSAEGVYSACTGSGQCTVDAILDEGESSYGGSADKTIDTQKPFNMRLVFDEDPSSGLFVSYTTTLT